MDAGLRIGVAAMALATLWSGAEAQDGVGQGREIARTWCAGCHVVDGAAAGSDTAPPFAAIAQDPALSAGRLRAWLADPHPPMPNLALAREEIEALVAYIGSLRTE